MSTEKQPAVGSRVATLAPFAVTVSIVGAIVVGLYSFLQAIDIFHGSSPEGTAGGLCLLAASISLGSIANAMLRD